VTTKEARMTTKRFFAGALGAAFLLQVQATHAAPTPEPKPQPPVGIKLSDGRLTLFAGNPSSATFIEPDSMAWTGSTAIVMTYTVFEPPHAIAPGKIVVQAVNRHRIDCAARTRQDLGSEAYDVAGRSLVWLPERPTEPLDPKSMYSFVVQIVCDKVELPASNTVQSHVGARVLALQALAANR
jgi:hypothetical protein